MTWDLKTGGDWDTASNWVNSANPNDHHVPTSSDNAVIDIISIKPTTITFSVGNSDSVNSLEIESSLTTLDVSNGSLSIASTSTIAGNLTMSGGTLSPTAGLTIDGSSTWSGGVLAGNVINAGTLTTSGGTEYLTGTLTNTGTIDVAGGGTISTYNNTATIDNQAGATFDFQSDVSLSTNHDGYSGTFNNSGLLEKTAGTGNSAIVFTLNDSGTVEADSGTLIMPDDGSGTDGVINADGSGVVSWGGTYSGSFSGSGSGAVQLSGLAATGSVGVTLDFAGSVLQWTGGRSDRHLDQRGDPDDLRGHRLPHRDPDQHRDD